MIKLLRLGLPVSLFPYLGVLGIYRNLYSVTEELEILALKAMQ